MTPAHGGQHLLDEERGDRPVPGPEDLGELGHAAARRERQGSQTDPSRPAFGDAVQRGGVVRVQGDLVQRQHLDHLTGGEPEVMVPDLDETLLDPQPRDLQGGVRARSQHELEVARRRDEQLVETGQHHRIAHEMQVVDEHPHVGADGVDALRELVDELLIGFVRNRHADTRVSAARPVPRALDGALVCALDGALDSALDSADEVMPEHLWVVVLSVADTQPSRPPRSRIVRAHEAISEDLPAPAEPATRTTRARGGAARAARQHGQDRDDPGSTSGGPVGERRQRGPEGARWVQGQRPWRLVSPWSSPAPRRLRTLHLGGEGHDSNLRGSGGCARMPWSEASRQRGGRWRDRHPRPVERHLAEPHGAAGHVRTDRVGGPRVEHHVTRPSLPNRAQCPARRPPRCW